MAKGFFCIAIGDDTYAEGAYQVVTSDKITVPSYFTKDIARQCIIDLERKKIECSKEAQFDLLSDFPRRASSAIDLVINTLKNKFFI